MFILIYPVLLNNLVMYTGLTKKKKKTPKNKNKQKQTNKKTKQKKKTQPHSTTDDGRQDVYSAHMTASLANWLRRPPRKRKTRGSNPTCDGIFPGRVIPVT